MAKKGSLTFGQIYDNIYGFIRLTSTEEQIINSIFYQRLRWIKQLGFATYIFDGAEHTRFAHAVGVCHSADQMVRALGQHVADEKLFDVNATDPQSLFHKSVRIAALLHDIGTFPFSHSIEFAYIKHGFELEKQGKLPGKQLPNNHEHLGSYIIKKTDFEGGLTRILKNDGFDFAKLSKFIKGDSDNLVANQILHSDLDADRMDYLIRDAHHTGIKYGQVDRDYILYHLATYENASGRLEVGLKENALNAAEDFLIARFSWYSQVVRNSSAAKFDVLASDIAGSLLTEKLIYSYQDLLDMAAHNPERFFGFNDVYFMSLVQNLYWEKKVKNPQVLEKMRMLIYRIPPRTLRIHEFRHRLFAVDSNGKVEGKEKALEEISAKLSEIREVFKKHGKGSEWVVADIPTKDVFLMQDLYDRVLTKKHAHLSDEARKNSLVGRLNGLANFIPNVYVNPSGYELLEKKKLV